MVAETNPSDGDNLNNVWRESSRTSNKKKERKKGRGNIWKTKLINLKQKEHIRDLCRSINEFQKCYHNGTNLVNYENWVLFAYFQNFLNTSRKKNYFGQLLNSHRTNDIRQTEIQAAAWLVSEHSFFEVEIATELFNVINCQSVNRTPVELIQVGGMTLHCEIYKLIPIGVVAYGRTVYPLAGALSCTAPVLFVNVLPRVRTPVSFHLFVSTCLLPLWNDTVCLLYDRGSLSKLLFGPWLRK
jgi:hypothetical protein